MNACGIGRKEANVSRREAWAGGQRGPVGRGWRGIVGALLLLLALPVLADPPARAGRVSLLQGDVRVQPEPEADWRAAAINWPLTAGSRLESGRFSRAEVRIGSLAVRLGEESELTFTRLDDERVMLEVARGSVDLRVPSRELAEEVEVATPQARVVFGDAGHYRIDVVPRREATAVTSRAGIAYLYGEDAALAVPAGRRGELFAGRSDYLLDDPGYDDFDAWVQAEEHRYAEDSAGRYVSPEMTGYEVLDRYGRWEDTADYGAVWYPSALPAGWAPYRFGEWVWFSTWGWTWVDHAPWGFAPSHYGRWVVLAGRWSWVPGQFVTRPVFAPAVVRWKTVHLHRHQIPSRGSWAPLGPREKFVPSYRASERHILEVNRPHRSGFEAGGERRKFVLPDQPPLAPVTGGTTVGGGAVGTPAPAVAPLPGSVVAPLVAPRRGERAGLPVMQPRSAESGRDADSRGRRGRSGSEERRSGADGSLREKAVAGTPAPVGGGAGVVVPGGARLGVPPFTQVPGRMNVDRGPQRADGALRVVPGAPGFAKPGRDGREPGVRGEARRELRSDGGAGRDRREGRREARQEARQERRLEQLPERTRSMVPPPVATPQVVVPPAASPPPGEGRRKWLRQGGGDEGGGRPAGRGGRFGEAR